MNDAVNEKPNWKKWQHMKVVSIFEAMCLLNDLEPNQFDRTEGLIFHESSDGSLRRVPKKSIWPKQLEESKQIFDSYRESGFPYIYNGDRVDLKEFGEWAKDAGFSLPKEFPEYDGTWCTIKVPFASRQFRLLIEVFCRYYKNSDGTIIDNAALGIEIEQALWPNANPSSTRGKTIAGIFLRDAPKTKGLKKPKTTPVK